MPQSPIRCSPLASHWPIEVIGGVRMLDNIVRIGFLGLGGVALGLGCFWFLHFCYQEWSGTAQVVIDPLTVIDDSGKSNEEAGKALALMLQSRLESLTSELREAQASLTAPSTPAPVSTAEAMRVGDVRLWTQDVALQTGLLQPIEMKLSVGGIDVGGALPWLQRQLSNRRTLHFTVYSTGDERQVFGSVAPMRLPGAAVRLHVKGRDGKPPSLDAVVDALAHELVRRWLAQDPANRVELLHPEEFVSLSDILVGAAASNRRATHGRPAQDEFLALVPRIVALSEEVPDWPQLGYFAAWIADKARDTATAVTYYKRVVTQLDPKQQADLIGFINSRVAVLGKDEPPPKVAAGPAEAEPAMKAALDLAPRIKFIRDNGSEGSVVGQALATALEFQIAKALKEERRISARYIYYAARQVAGTTEADSGARIKDGIAALLKEGAVEEAVWPYVPGEFAAKPPRTVETAPRYRITDARQIKGLNELKLALAKTGPVVAGITMYESGLSPETARTGILPLPEAKTPSVGGHAVVMVGYDDDKQLVKFANSWGPGWGQRGFGFIPYEFIRKHMYDAWSFKLAAP